MYTAGQSAMVELQEYARTRMTAQPEQLISRLASQVSYCASTKLLFERVKTATAGRSPEAQLVLIMSKEKPRI
jgi:hypothetical protein